VVEEAGVPDENHAVPDENHGSWASNW
jgi:hypothetical protein